MTPAARTQAAIEVLDEVIAACEDGGPAADTILQRYFGARRYAGSGDRRAVRELVYETIRALGERPASGRAALLGARPDLAPLFGEGPHGPEPLGEDEAMAQRGRGAPEWLIEKLGDRFHPALLERAPLDLRVNALKASRGELPNLGAPIPDLPHALRGAPEDIARRDEHALGLVEIQDAGSQHVAAFCEARPGELVVDLCAGGGGKTLALAADMRDEGRIVAVDADRARLARLPERAERAGASIVDMRLVDPGRERAALADLAGRADLVLIDAPCSGTGTWRRNPEAKWRLTPRRLQALTNLQQHLLGLGAELVRPGGRLVYAVCSLLPEEGDERISRFLREHADWRPGAAKLLTPQADATDGFFIARCESAC